MERGLLIRPETTGSNGMILSTHALVGAAIASFVPSHPATAFALGFASHFVLDAIPHWDYPIQSASLDPKVGAPLRFDRALVQDALTIGFDGLFGVIGALLLFASVETRWVVLLGAFGAMLPDALLFVYGLWPHEPLKSLQRFHRWCHSKRELKDRVCLGIVSQLFLIIVVTAATMAAHNGSFLASAFAAAG